VHGAAKVNVGWRVGPRRDDGYHDVDGLIQTITLADRIEIVTKRRPGDLTVVVPKYPELAGSSNLVDRAARLLAERVGEPPETEVLVHKQIPIAAGLGGGSADAAATLVGLNVAWRAGLDVRQLLELGSRIGSDVPAMMAGGLVAVAGRGERTRSIGSFDDGWVVLGVGAEQASTATVYELFDQTGARPSTSDGAGAIHHNDLELAACELVPGLGDRVDAMRAAAGIAFVSGSGPTVVGVAATERRAHAIAECVAPEFVDVLIAQPCAWGVRLVIAT
jgi:4-diphosphocytidyl-2-C-methyl-D-erythritol kinase